MTADRAAIRHLAAGQDGVVSLAQAGVHGMSADAVQRRAVSGEWLRLLPGIYSVNGMAPGAAGFIRAVCLWGGRGTVIGGPAAAWWWGLTEAEPRSIDLFIPPRRMLSSQPRVRVHRSPIPASDQVTHRGVRVVSEPFAALFGTLTLGSEGRRILDRALLRRVRLSELDKVVERNTGRHGAAAARKVLKACGDGSASAAERLFIDILKAAGITGWKVNHGRQVAGRLVMPDFTFEAARLVVEIDGWAHHSDPKSFATDRVRQNNLILNGWRVLRFTWHQLNDNPAEVLRQVLAALTSPHHAQL